ncbi:Alpha/Beta hydrolase protein [Desarmillaria tabescens]|uniref:Alpha/Beta hydrolase protein n=1 Tax=Armillaria tabescens TaxID=1929756 RepID=A0AA39JQL4_ARMTA|nr:Alpha/Beta hydrolase protein [Desarmillaria tabescens]KAK0446993.1 Alpha/Beta hydrolase protein [Desarmillaria tabescens]
MASSETPFNIFIPDDKLKLLQQKLALVTFPDELEDSGMKYGVLLKDIQRLGFRVLNIHYVHKKSKVEDAVPLLFVHGWPGSFIEAPLPVAHKLMLALGYNKYVTEGGDWGGFITRKIALVYGSKHSKALHTNMAIGCTLTFYEPILYLCHLLMPYMAAEKARLACTQWFTTHRSGYSAEHSTQPQTLGYLLADSPVGLLAWIYEKLVNWTDTYPWDDDVVLMWISIYFFSRSGPTASIHIYYKILGSSNMAVLGQKPAIPNGLLYFPKEVMAVPHIWTHTTGNIIFESEHTSGGHFLAHEKLQELVDDVRMMFGKGGPAFGVVPGKTGYK